MQTQALQSKHTRYSPLLEVAPDVACRQLSIVNVFLVGEPGARDRSWALVDTGLGTSVEAIQQAAGERFGPARPAAIILTHGHFDHVGSARRLAEMWGAPIYAHRLEMPYLTGRSDYPPPDPTVGGGAVATLGSRFFPKSGTDLQPWVEPLPEDGTVPGMPGWRWIHTPGHTPGHVALFRDADRTLIAGDAFVTTRQESFLSVMTRRQEVWRPPAYFTPDWEAARRSVQELAALRPNVAGTGHGVPMFGESLRQQLDNLATNFDEYIPDDGRYVRQPALADERGLVMVPPPVRDALPFLLAAGAAVALGAVFARGRVRASRGY
ncbi:MAG TPA: MBL fold metallo-hydrolase [Thermoanaerobaculia bacterium]|nr:MBL fold metallo-hydrolase [Thermoanaerobaculia bacterium]